MQCRPPTALTFGHGRRCGALPPARRRLQAPQHGAAAQHVGQILVAPLLSQVGGSVPVIVLGSHIRATAQ